MQKLKYEKFRNSNEIITIDLHSGYTVIAISTWNNESRTYVTSLFLKNNSIDRWELIEEAENLEFKTNQNTINSAVLKKVSTFLEEGFFEYYINRYKNYQSCIDERIDFISEDMGNTSAS